MAIGRAKKRRLVGRYELFFELAQSYLGSLWIARVASGEGAGLAATLRTLTSEGLSENDVARLGQAARDGSGLSHEGILPVVEVVTDARDVILVSDCVEAEVLRAIHSLSGLRRRPMSVGIALRIGSEILESLHALHTGAERLGDFRVYGGVSPDSILVDTSGKTRITDVGIAALACTLDVFGGHPERIAYSAPEQVEAGQDADARTDLFTVGIILWEMLTNRRLFIGSDRAVAQKVLAAKIPRLDEVKRRGDFPIAANIIQLVDRALQRDPSRRFQSAREMIEAIHGTGEPLASPEEVGEFVSAIDESALERRREAIRDVTKGKGVTPLSAHVDKAGARPAAAAPPAPRKPEEASKPVLPAPQEARRSPGPLPLPVAAPNVLSRTPRSVEGPRGSSTGLPRPRMQTIMGIAPPALGSNPRAQAPPPVPSASSAAPAPKQSLQVEPPAQSPPKRPSVARTPLSAATTVEAATPEKRVAKSARSAFGRGGDPPGPPQDLPSTEATRPLPAVAPRTSLGVPPPKPQPAANKAKSIPSPKSDERTTGIEASPLEADETPAVVEPALANVEAPSPTTTTAAPADVAGSAREEPAPPSDEALKRALTTEASESIDDLRSELMPISAMEPVGALRPRGRAQGKRQNSERLEPVPTPVARAYDVGVPTVPPPPPGDVVVPDTQAQALSPPRTPDLTPSGSGAAPAREPQRAGHSAPPSSLFPSKVPPPLIHDPRAQARHGARKTRPRAQTFLLGAVGALGVVLAGVALGFALTRHQLQAQEPSAAPPASAGVAPVVSVAPLPTPSAAKPPPEPAVASPPKPALAAPAPDAAAEQPPESESTVESPPSSEIPPPRRPVYRRRSKPETKRFIPDDI